MRRHGSAGRRPAISTRIRARARRLSDGEVTMPRTLPRPVFLSNDGEPDLSRLSRPVHRGDPRPSEKSSGRADFSTRFVGAALVVALRVPATGIDREPPRRSHAMSFRLTTARPRSKRRGHPQGVPLRSTPGALPPAMSRRDPGRNRGDTGRRKGQSGFPTYYRTIGMDS